MSEKEKNSIIHLHNRLKEQESSESEIEPEVIEEEEEEKQEQSTNTQATTEEREMIEDENTYEGDIQPTAEDYERYKQMMSENGMLSFN